MGSFTPRRRSPDRLSAPVTLSRSTSSATLGALMTLTSVSTAVSSSRASIDDKADWDDKNDKSKEKDAANATDTDEFAELRQRRAEMAAMASRVWALYEAGAPLFTRDALRSLARQLDQQRGVRSGAQNTTVTVCGMDGQRVRLATQSGAVSASAVHPDIVLVNVKPQIDYWTIEKLTGNALWHIRRFDPARAFLPLRISHSQEARYRDASGTISASGSSTVAELASDLALKSLSAMETATSAPAAPPKAARLAVDEVRSVFRRHRAAWEASDACQQLRETLFASLAPQLVPRGRAVVRNIVAFACSSMSEEREGGSARHAVQHAMMLTVRDVLEEIQAGSCESEDEEDKEKGEATDEDEDFGGKAPPSAPPSPPRIACFAQDPAYDAADVAVLADEGIAVLDDPHGFLAVDECSVVIAVAPSVPVRQIVADLARPAAMIWGRIASGGGGNGGDARPSPLVDDMGGWSDPASSRVRQMIEAGYAEFDFPRDPQNFGTVDGVALYVRTAPLLPPPSPPPEEEDQGWGTTLFQRLQRTLLCQSTV